MNIHILGISGTFMASLAILAGEAGYKVTGSDANCYPPISDILKSKGIRWTEGYDDCSDMLKADLVLVGNVMKRGMPAIETLLNTKIPYLSGPEWLARYILPKYRVIAVAGTHGKTTTTSMLAHILEDAGLAPGFLIGGVAPNFNRSARLGTGQWFVLEADEYDSAFFDKRPKFMHYRPEIAILNNLEYDHADIYPNLEAIQLQFHYLLRTLPSKGLVISPKADLALKEVMQRGLYSEWHSLSLDEEAVWRAELISADASAFKLYQKGVFVGELHWSLIGRFNVENALAAIAAAVHAGVEPSRALESLTRFKSVKRRLELKSNRHQIAVYDDFAHHPSAISKTIQALKASQRHQRILLVLEFASNTMRSGVHAQALEHAFDGVDRAYFLEPKDFSLSELSKTWHFPHGLFGSTDEIVDAVDSEVQAGDAVVVMSNRGFAGIHQLLMDRIDQRFV